MFGDRFSRKGTESSSFWLSPSYFTYGENTTKAEKGSADLLKMASIKRSVGNFVSIVTGMNIPVKFKTKGMSCTDGKVVYISADMKEFDTVCGVALHEGSHIKLTDFNKIKQVWENPMVLLSEKFLREVMVNKFLKPKLKVLQNYVEDRRIDNFIYTTAPGYQGYYNSMYDSLWNSKEITKALGSDLYREETWESYFYRIINLTNPERDLNSLKGLQEIWDILNLKEIGRLTNTDEVTQVAVRILEVVEKYIAVEDKGDEDKGDGEKGEEQGEGQGEGNGSGEAEDGGPSDSNDEDGDPENGKAGKPQPGNGSGTTGKPMDLRGMSDEDIEKLVDDIEKQKKFLEGDVDKEEISEEEGKSLESMEEAGTTEKQVAKGNEMTKNRRGNDNDSTETIKSCAVTVIRNMTKSLIETDPLGIFAQSERYTEQVEKGLKLGAILGKKLQVRNESRTLKTTRLRNGKIDDRLINSLGYGAEQVFEKTFIDVFNPLIVHISIDASGSMGWAGKWEQTQVAVVAIAKAASMISNLDVVISYRTSGRGYGSSNPVVLYAYDSRKDNIMKVKKLFPYIVANGATPESLCFEAIEDEMTAGTATQDSYFINFSDGEPSFSNQSIYYTGQAAVRHCKKMMNGFRKRGINILSYFVGGSYDMGDFKEMYGKDAESINVEEVVPLAKTLNKFFATK